MKRKLPSYTLKEALERVNPCDPRYTLEKVKKMFPGKSKITSRDVLEIPARKFKTTCELSPPGINKRYATLRLMPSILFRLWNDFEPDTAGSSADIKRGLKLCKQYENGELDEL